MGNGKRLGFPKISKIVYRQKMESETKCIEVPTLDLLPITESVSQISESGPSLHVSSLTPQTGLLDEHSQGYFLPLKCLHPPLLLPEFHPCFQAQLKFHQRR